MDSSTIAAIAVMLVGVLTPAIIAVVNNPMWSSQTKRIIAIAGAVLLGIITVVGNTVWTDWQLTLPNIITAILAVVGASQAAYALLWKPTGTAEVIEAKFGTGSNTDLPAAA